MALVTGAGAGIGFATASAFAEAGASVIVADSNAALLEEAAGGLRSAGHEVRSVTCDVRDRNQVRAMTEQAVDAYGRLDAAFNNAGINCDGAPLLEPRMRSSTTSWTSICGDMELHEGRASADDRAGKRGNRQLLVDRRDAKGRAAYSASKFGVIGLTRAAALDYANTGIRINTVCPGIIGNMPMAARVTKNNNPDIIKAFIAAEPIGRLGEPEEIGAAVLILLSRKTASSAGSFRLERREGDLL